MFPNLVLKDMPSWLALTKAQQRHVYELCIYPLLRQWPILILRRLILFGLAVWVMCSPLKPWQIGLYMFAIFFIVDELVDLLFISHHKGSIDLFIHTHATEIAAV